MMPRIDLPTTALMETGLAAQLALAETMLGMANSHRRVSRLLCQKLVNLTEEISGLSGTVIGMISEGPSEAATMKLADHASALYRIATEITESLSDDLRYAADAVQRMGDKNG